LLPVTAFNWQEFLATLGGQTALLAAVAYQNPDVESLGERRGGLQSGSETKLGHGNRAIKEHPSDGGDSRG
jgi:hypothetical protein